MVCVVRQSLWPEQMETKADYYFHCLVCFWTLRHGRWSASLAWVHDLTQKDNFSCKSWRQGEAPRASHTITTQQGDSWKWAFEGQKPKKRPCGKRTFSQVTKGKNKSQLSLKEKRKYRLSPCAHQTKPTPTHSQSRGRQPWFSTSPRSVIGF